MALGPIFSDDDLGLDQFVRGAQFLPSDRPSNRSLVTARYGADGSITLINTARVGGEDEASDGVLAKDSETQRQRCVLPNLHGIDVANDGSFLLAISADEAFESPSKNLYYIDIPKMTVVHQLAFAMELHSIRISRDMKYGLTTTSDSDCHLIDLATTDTVQVYSTGVHKSLGNINFNNDFGGSEEEFIISGSEGLYSL